MKAIFTKPFVRDYQKLPPDRQEQFDKQLELLLANTRHPSLEARIVDRRRRIWKAKVSSSYRFTFQIEDDTVVLRRTGTHDEMERTEHW